MEFPLIQRELIRQGRRRSTFLLRLVGPALCAAYLLLTVMGTDGLSFLVPDPVLNTLQITPQTTANALAFAAILFQSIIAFVGAPVLASGSIAEERQERTLNLITIANMRHSNIVFAKFAACCLPAWLLLLSTLPIGAFAAYFGGVTLRGIAIQFAVFAAWTTASCALGVWMSAGAQRTRDALLRTFVLQIGALAALLYIDNLPPRPGILSFSPIIATSFANDATAQSFYFWPAVAIPAAFALVALLMAVWTIRRTDATRAAADPVTRFRRRFRVAPFITLAAALGRNADARRRSLIGASIFAIVIAAVAAVPVFGWLIVLGLVMYEVIGPMARSRNSGAWDDLAVSPAPDRSITIAVYFGQLRNAVVYVPALFVADTMTLLLAQLIFSEMPGRTLEDHLVHLFKYYHGTKIIALFVVIKLMQGLFVVALATLLGAIGRRPTAQIARGIIFFAAFYAFLTVAARTIAEENFIYFNAEENREYLTYAYIAAVFYAIPYGIGIAGILTYLSSRMRALMRGEVRGSNANRTVSAPTNRGRLVQLFLPSAAKR